MNDNSNKDIIEIIKKQLKEASDLPYKEGAWESFKSKHEVKEVRRVLPAYWAAAAALALVGFTTLFIVNRREDLERLTANSLPSVTERNISQSQPTTLPSGDKEIPLVLHMKEGKSNDLAPQVSSGNPVEKSLENIHSIDIQVKLASVSLSSVGQEELLSEEKLETKMNSNVFTSSFEKTDAVPFVSDIGGSYVMAQAAATKQSERDISPKKIKFTDKFEIGAFLSPSTTSQNFDVGGGLVLAYQLSPKIELRTGASFNQYEVGILASDIRSNGGEYYESPSTNAQLVSKDVPYRANSLLLPDLNSVTGKVQTLDVPFEIKYNVGRQFYATGGLSYAVVLSQERFNHFNEYADVATYSSESNSDQPTKNPSSVVERTLQTSDNNVNPNGFGGFVNFSIGRRGTLGRNLKISVEPFVKIPLGRFKTADMNYTNGGVKIITNF
ncbi:outer membrane beta-barrel protein [Sphingobacterium sp. LRF_L2]|uniref:outer membrane beta-barrel protein n=1 Tax=Sphingobacterium sp. LRF_L2 TaxID=3369421 RepID=UPI003F5ECBC3